jgi:ubiquitin-like-conjugating enzyme ATG3
MITYDKYYQTPRVWLIGYDEVRHKSFFPLDIVRKFHRWFLQNGTLLTPPQIFQDISADHAHKTVTIEPFIHSISMQAASVHPCKHASVMKKVIERMNNSVVAEQLAQRKGPSPSKDGKDGKRKWTFGRKVSGMGKDTASASANAEDEEIEGMRVDFYLVVFLKFIASIVPTIEVDSTTSF